MVRSLSRRTFSAAAVLALIAGFVDGVGFVTLGGAFVSFMSGNTTRASVDLTRADWTGAIIAIVVILAFVVGVIAGTVMPTGRMPIETRILTLVVVMIVIAAAALTLGWTLVSGAALAFAMGAMNTVFARGGEVGFGITYMTGALVKLGQGIVTAARGGGHGPWMRNLVLWGSMGFGAALGAIAFVLAGAGALWVLAVVMVVLLVLRPARAWMHG